MSNALAGPAPPPSPVALPELARLPPHASPMRRKGSTPFPSSMSGFSRTAPLSPIILDSLTRPTLPSSSVSSTTARFPDLSKPQPVQLGLSRSISGSSKTWGRSRSASIGSLQSVVQHSPTDSAWMASRRSSVRKLSSGSAASIEVSPRGRFEDLPAIDDDESWSTPSWWPFSDPAKDVKGKGRAEDQDHDAMDGAGEEDGKAPTRSFMEYFAGRGAVEDAKEGHDAKLEADLIEAGLLDASLRTLKISTTEDGRKHMVNGGAGHRPPPSTENDSSAKPSSFLPTNIFSSNPFTAAPLEGPSSLFSSFSIPNPFATTPVSASPTASPPRYGSPPSASSIPRSRTSFSLSNPFAPSASLSTSPPKALHHGRSYSNGPGGTKLKDVTPMLDEEDTEAAKVEDDSHMDMFALIKERYTCPKYPIVFCHGLFGTFSFHVTLGQDAHDNFKTGFDTIGPAAIKPLQFSYWIGVKEALEAIGVEVLIGRVPAAASIEERAKVLCEQIEQTFPGREVNLIGHSMGGLDGRFLISHLKPTTFKVKSLTTIATPHRGSAFADYIIDDFIGSQRVTALMGVMAKLGIQAGAFNDLTTSKMVRFNEETPDDPNVKYFSYGAEFAPGWSNVFRMSWGVISEREGANDGLVSVESSKWGQYQATLTNVNHLDLVGWVGKVRYGWAEWLGKPIKFKPVSFFLAIAEMLADEGF
ncbi:triacylglycerol lipase, partial [Phenoliferia sp. Uapishka_3]